MANTERTVDPSSIPVNPDDPLLADFVDGGLDDANDGRTEQLQQNAESQALPDVGQVTEGQPLFEVRQVTGADGSLKEAWEALLPSTKKALIAIANEHGLKEDAAEQEITGAMRRAAVRHRDPVDFPGVLRPGTMWTLEAVKAAKDVKEVPCDIPLGSVVVDIFDGVVGLAAIKVTKLDGLVRYIVSPFKDHPATTYPVNDLEIDIQQLRVVGPGVSDRATPLDVAQYIPLGAAVETVAGKVKGWVTVQYENWNGCVQYGFQVKLDSKKKAGKGGEISKRPGEANDVWVMSSYLFKQTGKKPLVPILKQNNGVKPASPSGDERRPGPRTSIAPKIR